MTKLTQLQRDLLEAAAESDTESLEAPADRKTFAALIKKGFVICVPQAEGPSQLLITNAGRGAITPTVEGPAPETEQAPPGESIAPPAPKGKIGALVTLLRAPDGATIEAMMAATGWQAHSVRGAMSGSVKKALGLNVVSEKTDGVRVYRIVEGIAA
jgi:hypothetical protein